MLFLSLRQKSTTFATSLVRWRLAETNRYPKDEIIFFIVYPHRIAICSPTSLVRWRLALIFLLSKNRRHAPSSAIDFRKRFRNQNNLSVFSYIPAIHRFSAQSRLLPTALCQPFTKFSLVCRGIFEVKTLSVFFVRFNSSRFFQNFVRRPAR